LFVLNFVKCIGEIMVYAHLDVGFCFIDVGFFAYYALYAPLLYVCFLRDFFRDVTLPYGFVEMSKSGYLDSDTWNPKNCILAVQIIQHLETHLKCNLVL